MTTETTFPDRKISEAFLEFAEPLLEGDGVPPTPEEVEKVLQLAFVVWNAVVLDAVHGNDEWLSQVRNQVADQAPIAAFVEQLIERKKNGSGHDLRLVASTSSSKKTGNGGCARKRGVLHKSHLVTGQPDSHPH